jgi:hypothetical protein
MDTDIKCELASELVNYIWYNIVNQKLLAPEHHSFTATNGDIVYTEVAQDMFSDLLGIIEKVTEE